MNEAISGLKDVADGTPIAGSEQTEQEAIVDHNRNLRALLDRCRERGIKLKLNRPTTVYCRHELTRDAVLPDKRNVAAIVNMPPPIDRQGVVRLLGMATYLAKFCNNFSEVTAPIRSLLLKENEFDWKDNVQGTAFEKLKRSCLILLIMYFKVRNQSIKHMTSTMYLVYSER